MQCRNGLGKRIGRIYNGATLTGYEGTWVHLACTYSGNNASSGIKLFVNCVRVDDANSEALPYTGMTNTAEPLYIGSDGTGVYAEGKMDEASLWDIELNLQDLKRIMLGLHPLV